MIEKLAKEYARFFTIDPMLWEVEPMLASGHFQDQIVPPSETDIVVLIVWSRLGTPLPEKTEKREYRGIDGRIPVTGTEWEFEDALAAQRAKGAPDLLAYRKDADPKVSLKDKGARALAEVQWEKLDQFWQRWFVDRGEFRAAFATFGDLDGFEANLERDLRALIERRIKALSATEQDALAPIWLSGSPFRGLETYRFEHSSVFFGRSAMVKAAVEQLSGNAENGRAFLLILGASGAGKSSLAQAGVLPALTGRGIVPGIGLWRRAVMRPGGHPRGPFAALADSLVGETALPELTDANQHSEALAQHLKASAADPTFPILSALNRIEESARARGDLLKVESARLVLVVDQLEELFTASDITIDARRAFVQCLDGLARCGRIFIVATLRSDYWHRTAEVPDLVGMAAGNGRLDLLPPAQDEIYEMIRQPAAAAGLVFETDPARDIRLDATLAAEAGNEPGALPLLSFLLDELYKRDVQGTGRSTLTFASMRVLGGLKGAIANRAEAVFETLASDVQAALPKVLRALVTVAHAGAAPTTRPAPLEHFSAGSPERKLVETLLDPQVRLLVADGESEGEGVNVRLAHEALISYWERAKRQIAQDHDDLRTRTLVEEAFAEWRKAPPTKQQRYLLRDPLLAAALDLTKRWAGEVDAETRRFIDTSRRRARLMQQLMAAAAVLFAIVALTASGLGIVAYRAQNQADQSLQAVTRERARSAANESDRRAALVQQLVSSDKPQLAAAVALDAVASGRDANKPMTRALAAAVRRALDQVRVPAERNLGENVWTLAIAPDGKTLAAGTVKGVVYVLDASTLQERFHFTAGTDVVSGLSFSPDGSRILAAGDKVPNVWDVATGKKLFDLNRPDARKFAKSARFSTDGSRIVVGTAENRALIHDAANGKLLYILPGSDFETMVKRLSKVTTADFGVADPIVHAVSQANWQIWGTATDAVFSPDGKLVAVTGPATPDGSVLLYDARTGKPVQTLTGGQGTMFTPPMNYGQLLWFSPDGSSVIAAPLVKTIKIWNVKSGALQTELTSRGVNSFLLTGDGQAVVSAHENGSLIFRCLSGGSIVSIQAHEDAISTLTTGPQQTLLASAGDDRTARIWQMPSGSDICGISGIGDVANDKKYDSLSVRRPVAIFSGHGARVTNAVFSQDDRRLITSSRDGWVRSWTIPSDAVEIGPLPKAGYNDRSLVVSRDGLTLLVAGSDDWQAWDLTTGSSIAVPDRTKLAASGDDGGPILFRDPDVSFFLRGAAPKLDDRDFGFGGFGPVSSDGSRLVVPTKWLKDKKGSDFDGAAPRVLLDAHLKTPLTGLTVADRQVSGFFFSPDGSRLFARLERPSNADNDKDAGDGLAVWDAKTGRAIVIADKISDYSISSKIIPSASGRHILMAASRPPSRLFEVIENQLKPIVVRGPSADGRVSAEALSTDGSLYVSGYANGTVAIIDVRSNELRRLLDTRGNSIAFVAMSPDSRYVAAVDVSNTLWIFDADSGELLKSQTCAFTPTSITFLPTSDRLLFVGEAKALVVQALPTVAGNSEVPAMVNWARKAGLNLVSEEERRRYKLGTEDASGNPGRYAALNPNSEGTTSVVWANTEEEARAKAIEACRKISKTCSSKPAVTQDLQSVFVNMCCTNPRRACATSVDSGERALLSVKSTLYGAGFSVCAVQSVMAARNGALQ